MKRQGRILGLALRNSGILQLPATRRRLNFDSKESRRYVEAEIQPLPNEPNEIEEHPLRSERCHSEKSSTEPIYTELQAYVPSLITDETPHEDTTASTLPANRTEAPMPTSTELQSYVPSPSSDETHKEDATIPALPDNNTAVPMPTYTELQNYLPSPSSDETAKEDATMPALPDNNTAVPMPTYTELQNYVPSPSSDETAKEDATMPALPDNNTAVPMPTYTELQNYVPSPSSDETAKEDATMPALPDNNTAVPTYTELQNYVSSNSPDETVNEEAAMFALPEKDTLSIVSSKSPPVTSSKQSSSRRRRERRAKLKKQHLDYLSDEEALLIDAFGECDTDSDLWVEASDTDSTENEEERSGKKRKKRAIGGQRLEEHGMVGELGIKNKRSNKRAERKQKKNSGQEYTTCSGVVVNAKTIQPNPCKGKKCGNDCGSISEERRQCIFNHYWKLAPERRKDWLVSLSQRISVKRKRNADSNKRSVTYKYFINEGEGKKPVCLQFLAATIAIAHKTIYYTVSNAVLGTAKDDLRGKCEPSNKTKEATKILTHNFIKSLPAVPSHRCRSDSTRVYLPQEYKNLSNLYQIYKNRYCEAGIDFVSDKVFRSIFNEDYNIGFHVPKKDKCKKCLNFEKDPNLETEKLKHEEEKKSSYERFKAHQNVHTTQSNTLCVSFDLEKVLNTPHGQSMLLYYSRKLAVYNLCFYESNTRNVYCFYWDEVNGKRGANEIASILNTYIKMVDERGTVKHLLLYCDCCPGQNRNKTVLAMIHSTLQSCKNLETVQINFLLTGHTYMPVDSVHAVIERNTKNIIVYAPSQWYTVFSTARQNPKPYNVEFITHKDFMKWDTVCEKYFKGNLTGKISKIRIATFKKKDVSKITVKYSMDESDESISVEVQCKSKLMPTACYKNLLPISKAKYDDLSKLCKDNVIPAVFHREYLSLPSAGTVRDTLPESDIEDVDDD